MDGYMVTKGVSDDRQMGLDSLEVWQIAIACAVEVCRDLLPKLPNVEKYSLSQQIRRSVQSIPTNIAEGYGRYYYQEGIRFFYIARGSLEEVYTQLSMAYRLSYVTEDQYNHYNAQLKEIRRLINGYIFYLKNSKRGESEPGAYHQIREILNDDEASTQNPETETDEKPFG